MTKVSFVSSFFVVGTVLQLMELLLTWSFYIYLKICFVVFYVLSQFNTFFYFSISIQNVLGYIP